MGAVDLWLGEGGGLCDMHVSRSKCFFRTIGVVNLLFFSVNSKGKYYDYAKDFTGNNCSEIPKCGKKKWFYVCMFVEYFEKMKKRKLKLYIHVPTRKLLKRKYYFIK